MFCISNATEVIVVELIRKSPEPPVPPKPDVLYSRGRFVDMLSWTVG